MRLFIAVHLSPAARDAIQSSIDDFPLHNPPWRWVARENWHLTLKFLGDTEARRVDALCAGLDGVRRAHRAFELELGTFGGFPSLHAPRVLFYRAGRGAPEMERLAADVDAAVETTLGLPRERRPFRAHATVARIKNALPASIASRLASVPALSPAVTHVDVFHLMESRLQRAGAAYSVVKEFALA